MISDRNQCHKDVVWNLEVPTRGQWPYRVASDRAMRMASDLKPATSITLESICILFLKAPFMAYEALVASK